MLSKDFFKWTLVSSIVFHVIIVLGISFVMPEQDDNPVIGPPLRITLVSSASELEPEDTQTLAQTNSVGEENAATALPAPAQPTVVQQQSAQNTEKQNDTVLDSAFSESVIAESQLSKDREPTETPLTREQLTQEINLAYLNAHAQPREKYVSARAKESIYAAYIEKWRLLVERVGNLNYPEAARQQKLEGSLVLDVAINSQGEIEKVRVLNSSGFKVLDDAAIRIVHIASPYDRFSDSIHKEIDILHIVRTWEFVQSQSSATMEVQ